MKKTAIMLLTVVTTTMLTIATAFADTGGMVSLRGSTNLDSGDGADDYKRTPKDRETFERDYLHQPPLIPHQTRDYRINVSSNKCLSCHSWKNYKKAGATKISMTHFEARNGQQLSDVSPLRYFCTQCHVTQTDAKPLVKNIFKSVGALQGE